MIDWTEEGIVLAARRHGEADVLLSALTAGHGRHMGLVRGGTGRRLRGALEPGNRLRLTWKSRLDAQLGAFTIEPVDEVVGRLIDDADRLTALGAMAAVLDRVLPDRQAVPGLFERAQALILALEHAPVAVWGALFVMHERDLLAEMGFGLDLARCAVTGGTDDLAHVSPRTGRAVSRGAGQPYADRLLPLPSFLNDATFLQDFGPAIDRRSMAGSPAGPPLAEIVDGMRLTLYFLDRHGFAGAGRPPPPLRVTLAERLARRVAGARPSPADAGNTPTTR